MKKSAQKIVRRTRGRGTGSDTYLFNRGDGIDTIADAGEAAATDTLQFGADILQGDITITRLLNGDLSFGINGSASAGSGQAPDKITDQMRRRTHTEIINGGKAANDETTHAWRDAA